MRLTIDKMDKHDDSVRLHPRQFAIVRNKNALERLPIEPIETTHPISSDDIGPVSSGVSLDIHSGNMGVSQP